MRKRIVAGNWKMNKTFEEGKDLTDEIIDRARHLSDEKEVILIPPYIHLAALQRLTNGYRIKIGAQNCHTEAAGAYTGEVSAPMLKSVGVEYCLVGHSERRIYNSENDEERTAKIQALLNSAIRPIFCCGEQLDDRKQENHFDEVAKQLNLLWKFNKEEFKQIVVAYEPVWAIGTGETASSEQAQEMHSFIRKQISEQFDADAAESTTILYGGSCKAANAVELFSKEDVDGGLIGGASLIADDFVSIINALNS